MSLLQRLHARPQMAQGLGVLAIVCALPGLWLDRRMFFACWLVAWWFWLGLVLGGMTNAWIHRLSGGRWGIDLRAVALGLGRRMPWLLLLGLSVWAGLAALYPWAADPGGAWANGLSRPAFPRLWLTPAFFGLRLLAYAALWWWLCRPATLRRKGASAAALIVHSLVSSLAAVDLLMSLVPGWFSTAFGLVVLSGQALGGAAFIVLLLAHLWPPEDAATLQPPLWRDLGNLLLMWVMTWAYLAFMEFLIIWAENLPHEISWYLPRLHTGWFWGSVALVVLQLALPLLALLMRALKDRPQRLARIAALLLAAQAFDTAWLVLPSVAPHDLRGWWLAPLLLAGLGLLVFGRMPAPRPLQTDARKEVQHAPA